MAAQKGIGRIVEEEREIPVLTVAKNNAILKNIFLINAPNSHQEDSSKIRQDLEQTLLVGRHPNCQIRLEHPSISRFHLRIHTKPSLKRLSVTDLSSVHGTWISGKRIQPNIRVDVNEGDALIIGRSSRVYSLHWSALQNACESNKPGNIPLLDVPSSRKEKIEEVKMDWNPQLLENESESSRSPLKASQVLISNPSEYSKEVEDVNVLMVCKNGVANILDIECEHSAIRTSKAKAWVTNQFATLTKLEQEIVLAPKTEDEKPVDSASEASMSLPQSPNIKALKEREVLSVAPLHEATGDFNMQFMSLALDAVLHENSLLAELGAMDKVKGHICESSTGFQREQAICQIAEDEEYNLAPLEESLPINFITLEKENYQFVEDRESSQDHLIFSESEEFSNVPAPTSHLIDHLNCATTALIVDEASHRNEDQIPFNDEDEDGAWSFWFLNSPEIAAENNFIAIDKESQGTEGEIERTERNFSEDPSSSVNESVMWSFWSGIPRAESVYSSSFSDAEVLSQTETQLMNESSQFLDPMEKLCNSEVSSSNRAVQSICTRRGQFASAPQIQINRTMQEGKDGISTDNEDILLNGRFESITRELFAGVDNPEEEYFTPGKENQVQENYKLNSPQEGKKKSGIFESLCWSGKITNAMDSDRSLSAYSNKENQAPKYVQEQKKRTEILSADHMKLSKLTIGLAAQTTPLQTLFANPPQMQSISEFPSASIMSAYSNKENQTPKVRHTKTSILVKREVHRTPLQALSVYCFSKENQTQKKKLTTCHPSAQCTKVLKLAKREAQTQALFADSPQESIPGTHISGGASLSGHHSNKENLTPKFIQEQKSVSYSSAEDKKLFTLRTKEAQRRIPFQPLFVDSPQKTSYNTNYENFKHKYYCVGRVKRWRMVVDITCLLDKNSRKALQLLEGIKGTQLIVPLAVAREMEFMKEQAGIFRRNRDACLASQWIEECSVRSKCWIQIQNENDDVKFREEVNVLDYSLYLRGNQNEEEELVILSVDATRKIKAMAEGLICESADEFRESLVSPYSRRFLWADSWPRGQTWSHLDDVILRDHFYTAAAAPLKTSTAPKGLKLLLLNSTKHIHPGVPC
ncbi:hypothetical protein V2J09_004275 [Rumex salicifolius]